MGDQKSDQILTTDYFSFGSREKQQKMDFSMQIGDVCVFVALSIVICTLLYMHNR